MKGFYIFFVLLVLSTVADGLSTFWGAVQSDDWSLKLEANPLVRGTSLEMMVWQGVGFTLLWSIAFVVAWVRRRELYPQEPARSFSEFWRYLNHGLIPALRTRSRYPALRFGLLFLGVSVPISMIPMHLEAALMNSLVIAKVVTGRTRAIALLETVFLSLPCVLLGFGVLYWNHRYLTRKQKDVTEQAHAAGRADSRR